MIESDFLVSKAVEELIFGADWLERNKCLWDFATENLIVRSSESPLRVPLYGGHRKACVRRLYAGESVDLESYSQRDLAVKTIWSSRPPSHADWMDEPATLKPGYKLVRPLLADVSGVNQDEDAESLSERLQHAFETVNESMHTRPEMVKKR